MILSVSRRTDIPRYYTEWFLQRLQAGYVYTRNPLQLRQVSEVKITPDVIDCIVFWTKNPAPLLAWIERLRLYHYYFQFTLNAYGEEVEPGTYLREGGIVPIDTFRRLADKIGKQKVLWRYDPIILTQRYTMEYHCAQFERLAKSLCGYTEKCTVSFVDFYRKARSGLAVLGANEPDENSRYALLEQLSKIAARYGLRLEVCGEEMALHHLGIKAARCIDGKLIEKIVGAEMRAVKDKGQRQACGCMESIDIGMYDTCPSGCVYCYANHSRRLAERNFVTHDPKASFLLGDLLPGDAVKRREMKSQKVLQAKLF